MIKKEKEFISNLLLDISVTFPESNYKYGLDDDIHCIRVYGIQKADKNHFLHFTAKVISDFVEENFESLILLSDEDLLVEINEPSRFSLSGTVIARKDEKPTEMIDTDFLITAA